MYPDFRFLLEGIFKTHMPAWLGVIKTFGLLVAIAFLLASALLTRELKRKENEGLLAPEFVPLSKAKRFKTAVADGDAGGVDIYPHQRVGDIVVLALITGLIGAKIFNALETWQDFLRNPVENLFSGGGLTFYGGLLVAAAVLYWYCRKHRISVVHFCDAIAPSLMLAYGVGRIGCQLSGDGDWGIYNSAYITGPYGTLTKAAPGQFEGLLKRYPSYFQREFSFLHHVPHRSVSAFGGLPQGLFAQNFPHNVIESGILLPGCGGSYCSVLPGGVFPTSLYEAVACIGLFFVLWALRKKFRFPLQLFSLYLVLNGVERFLIEQIKVNYKYDWGFIHPAQSEIIAVLLVIIGTGLWFFSKRSGRPAFKKTQSVS